MSANNVSWTRVTSGYRASLAKHLLSLLVSLSPWFMFQPSYAEDPQDFLEVSSTISLEGAYRLSAPTQSPQSEGRVVVSVPISLNLKTLTGLELGSVSAQGLIIEEAAGAQGALLNDAHAYSNLRAEDRVELFELFWERSWSALTARLGKLDANDHFAVSEHESLLINGASGYSPSIFGMPSYPDSAWSAQLSFQSTRLDLSAGVFDGGSTTLNPTPTGARLWLSPSAYQGGLFYVAQVTGHLGALHSKEELSSAEALLSPQQDREFSARAPLQLTLGAWTHRGEVYPQADPSAPGLPSWGLYLTGDYTIASLARGGELGLGFQGAVSPHYHPIHVSGALTWTEVIKPLGWAHVGPSLALGLSYLALSGELQTLQLSDREQLIELTANLPLSPSLATSLSWVTLSGARLDGAVAHLVVARLLLGVF